MKSKVVVTSLAAAALIVAAVTLFPACVGGQQMPFGGEEDTVFAGKVWSAMKGYQSWRLTSDFYPGTSPHGMFLKMYYSMITVDGTPYHVIVKDNFGGEGATLEMVAAEPEMYLMAITVMVQREAGYDPDNSDWFWAKYTADGAIDKNADGMMLAGRVAKGMDMGCIACHAKASGNDYLFVND